MGRRAAITSFNEVQIVQGVGLLAAASTGSALNSSPVKAAPSCARTTWSGGHRSLGRARPGGTGPGQPPEEPLGLFGDFRSGIAMRGAHPGVWGMFSYLVGCAESREQEERSGCRSLQHGS